MEPPDPTHPIPNVLHGLEPLLHPAIRRWMERVTPRRGWDAALSKVTGQPVWWPSFREDVRLAYRDEANRFTRAVLKAQIDGAVLQLGITVALLHQVALVSENGYYKAFDEFTARGETVVNAVRAFLQSKGVHLHEPEFEHFREAGVGGAMRYIRYRYLAADPWYSKWHQERDAGAGEEGGGRSRAKAVDDAEPAGRYLKDWVSTSPPHPLVVRALRECVTRRHGLRPDAPITDVAAGAAWRDVQGFLSRLNDDQRAAAKEWEPKAGRASRFAQELAAWHIPFALTVFCVDPIRLTNRPQ